MEHKILWNNLTQVASRHNLPWLLVVDFNEVLTSKDKFGGLPINLRRSSMFTNCLNTCGMIDLGFHGLRYTWSNFSKVRYVIQERLDRGFANASWSSLSGSFCSPSDSNPFRSLSCSDLP